MLNSKVAYYNNHAEFKGWIPKQQCFSSKFGYYNNHAEFKGWILKQQCFSSKFGYYNNHAEISMVVIVFSMVVIVTNLRIQHCCSSI